jgi:hypothetical protein
MRTGGFEAFRGMLMLEGTENKLQEDDLSRWEHFRISNELSCLPSKRWIESKNIYKIYFFFWLSKAGSRSTSKCRMLNLKAGLNN